MNRISKKEQKIIKELSTSGIEIINFSRESQAPIVSERIQAQKDWVFWGSDNLYPDKLIRLADNSALHSAILDTKSKMIAGNHLMYESESSEAETFFKDATAENGGVGELIDRLAIDVAYFKGLALNIQYNKNSKIGTVRHSDFSYIRSGKQNRETNKVDNYFHSTRWDIATNKRVYSQDEEIYRPIQIVSFNDKVKNTAQSKKYGQLIVAKTYSPSAIYYPKPTYLGATNYIEVAAKIALFHKSQLDNGMTGNVHIHLKIDLTDPKIRIPILQELNDQYAGVNNAGKIILTYGTGDANVPIITPIETTGVHEALSILNEKVNQEIVSSHQIPRQLAQLDLKTGFGGLELAQAFSQFQNMYVSPSQNLIEGKLNEILEFNGINEKVKIEELKPSSPLLTESLLKLSITVDEAREIAKLKPMEDEKVGNKLLNDAGNGGERSTTNE